MVSEERTTLTAMEHIKDVEPAAVQHLSPALFGAMDPSTTLFTFILQTQVNVQSVHLIGSWDNFTSPYTMERDLRRGRGQWKGCYSFRNIVCDDPESSGSYKRNGGLKMGHTYYYYYEVDGSAETHDPKMPSTTHCPYLPGQTVNTLYIPIERSTRSRAASLTSMRGTDFKTMDPSAKYISPRPAPPVPPVADKTRQKTAPQRLRSRSSSRSLSPKPCWKRLFGKKCRSQEVDLRVSSGEQDIDEKCEDEDESMSTSLVQTSPAPSSSERSRTNTISPRCLEHFLSDQTPLPSKPAGNEQLGLIIPDEIVEDNEDDANFATSAVSEQLPYTTFLSPPPPRRPATSDTAPLTITNLSTLTLATARPSTIQHRPSTADLPKLETSSQPTSFLSTSSSVASPLSPQSPADEIPSFYDSTDEDDLVSSCEGDTVFGDSLPEPNPRFPTFEGYHLPRHNDDNRKGFTAGSVIADSASPPLLDRGDTDIPIVEPKLLGSTINSGLEDFVNELGWVADSISTRSR